MTKSSDLDTSGVDARLIEALHDKTWHTTLRNLETANLTDDGRNRLAAAIAVTEELSSKHQTAAFELIRELELEGVFAKLSTDDISVGGTAVLGINKSDLGRAISLLGARGFRTQRELSSGGVKALSKVGSEIILVPDSSSLTRVILQWRQAGARKGIRRILTPSLSDLAATRLPRRLWWIYFILRPFRLLATKTKRHRAAAPYVATPAALVGPLLNLVRPEPKDLVADLGCGDGRVLIEAVTIFGCRGLGVESEDGLARLARANVAAAGLGDRISIQTGDFFSAELEEVDVIFLFLPTSMTAKLLPHLFPKLSPTARVLAHEQSPVAWPIAPSRTHLVIDAAGITVGHIWDRSAI